MRLCKTLATCTIRLYADDIYRYTQLTIGHTPCEHTDSARDPDAIKYSEYTKQKKNSLYSVQH